MLVESTRSVEAQKANMVDTLKVFGHTADGVWAADGGGRIILWNQAAEKLLGYTAEEVVGRSCHRLLKGRDVDGRPFCGANCLVRRRVQGGQPIDAFNFQVRHADGRARWINVSIIAVPEELSAGQDVVLVHLFRLVGQGTTWPPPLRIYLLGPVMVKRADGSLVGGELWRRARVRALLAFFALRRGQPVHRDTLLQRLWPDLDYAAALRNLNTTIYGLRRSLEPGLQRGTGSGYIHYESDCYMLSGGLAHWLDVEAFESGIASARRESDPDRAEVLYQEALALYRDGFLADLEPGLLDGWLEEERLRQFYLNALEELGSVLIRRERERAAAEAYLKVLAVDACRESAVRQLMHLALRRGDRATALAHYESLRRTLWRELELLPGEETRQLYEMAAGQG